MLADLDLAWQVESFDERLRVEIIGGGVKHLLCFGFLQGMLPF